MKLFQPKLVATVSLVLFGCTMSFMACKKDNLPPPHVITHGPEGSYTVISDAGDVNDGVNAFRTMLGNTLNATLQNPIPDPNGRREITWDDVPPFFYQYLPIDFYATTGVGEPDSRKQGFLLLDLVGGPSTNFLVSTNGFAIFGPNLNYPAQFSAFSGTNSFAYVGGSSAGIMEAVFKVPGTNADAMVKGFGIVFSDVDKANTTSIEYFGENGSLGKFYVPVRSGTPSFSFLGVYFSNEKVTRIRITCGDGALGFAKDISDDSVADKDLVVVDDFIYSEPQPK